MNQPWRIELFGGLRAVQPDRTITRLRTQKTAALLAYLAYFRHRVHPRELLVEMLWPESKPAAARHSLRQELASLRRQLEPPGIRPGTILVSDRHQITLHDRAITTDIEEFGVALAAARRAENRDEQIRRLSEAARLDRWELRPASTRCTRQPASTSYACISRRTAPLKLSVTRKAFGTPLHGLWVLGATTTAGRSPMRCLMRCLADSLL